ncbi:hypothetical protein HY990_06385 [Candidatus Micrarchaeota archaeon]|nr:hypothetical protein [Candidatus Micrarchaeota archaeon]
MAEKGLDLHYIGYGGMAAGLGMIGMSMIPAGTTFGNPLPGATSGALLVAGGLVMAGGFAFATMQGRAF